MNLPIYTIYIYVSYAHMVKHVICNNVVQSMYEPGKPYNLIVFLLQPCNLLRTIPIPKLLQCCVQVVTSMCCLLITILLQYLKLAGKAAAIL